MKKIRSLLQRRIVWAPGAALFVPAVAGLLLKVLGSVHGVSLPTWMLDVGQNVNGNGVAGSVGSGAGSLGWPGGKDPYPLIGSGDDNPSRGGGNGQSGSGNPNAPPWWQHWIPSSWTSVPVAGPVSFDLSSGRFTAGGGANTGSPELGIPGFGVSASASAGAAPGSDPRGPLVNANGTVSIQTPLGNVQVTGSSSVGISQQVQQNVSAPSLGTQSQYIDGF